MTDKEGLRILLFGAGLVASLTLSTPVRAQSMEVGLVAGAAISNLVGDDVEDSESRTGVVIGAQFVFRSASVVGFQSGLIYTSKGAAFSDAGFEGFFKLGYIEIPALVRFSPQLAGSTLRPVFVAGGVLGIRVSCSAGISSGNVSIEADCGEDELEEDLETKTADFGLALGFGLDLPVGARMIATPGLRFTRGLFSIDDSPDDADVRNSSIELSVALRLRMPR